ncbi:MAG: phage Gp37/Gp68 family protein [Clostridia bacterium]|nr:phage Gp37/Gp68 family protein [Clostridia bacterium]
MGTNTKIEWTGATWNPLVGCSVVAAGCRNCYAMRMASRVEAMGTAPHYAGTTTRVNGKAVWTGKVNGAPEKIVLQPLRWKRPRRIFVNSMSDLFHESVPDEAIDRIFAVMALCPQHTFQVLTKRPDRMRAYLSTPTRHDIIAARWNYHPSRPKGGDSRTAGLWPFPNVWLGTSVSTQADADANIPHLLATPAAVRFLSCEPLLGPVDLRGIWTHCPTHDFASGFCVGPCPDRRRIDWVICGGESGPKRRPIDLQWARSLRAQCAAAGVPFFFKQVDKVHPIPPDLMVREWPSSDKRTDKGEDQ